MKELDFASAKTLHETLTVLSVFDVEVPLAICIGAIKKHIELIALGSSITHHNSGTVKKMTTTLCGSCGVGHLVGPYIIDGLQIVRCSKQCGYSEVTG